jgi:hypothetical protein
MSNPQYQQQNVKEYAGNPLIEALPPAFNDEQLISRLSNFKPVPENISSMSDGDRVNQASQIQSTIVPTSNFILMYKDIRRMLLSGYKERNPLQPKVIEWCYDLIINENDFSNVASSTGEGLMVCGLSGMGKTTMNERIMNCCFPQVILHPNHPEIVNPQITWIKFDMPSDASRSGLCEAFFSEVDDILNAIDSIEKKPNFGKQYKSSSISKMQKSIKNICATYHIGIIIVDELQNLNVAKAGGDDQILQFFDFISNKVKVPILKIGTPASIKLLGKKFQTGRRTGKSGYYELGPLDEQSSDWEFISQILWQYQLVKKSQPYTEEISKNLYKLSGGIVACLSQLLELSNIEAIKLGEEEITVKLLTGTYHKHFALIKDALKALRTGDKKQYEDLMLISDFKRKNVENEIDKIRQLNKSEKFTGQAAKTLHKLVEETEDKHILSDVDKLYCQELKAKLDKAIAANVKPVVTNNEQEGS